MTVATSKSTTVSPLLGYTFDPTSPSLAAPVFGQPRTITGSGCVDGRASYGFGLETFALGFPIHFDWSWRTLFNKDWEDYMYLVPGRARTADRQPMAAQGEVQRLDRIRFLEKLPATSSSFQLAHAASCWRLEADSCRLARLERKLEAGSW